MKRNIVYTILLAFCLSLIACTSTKLAPGGVYQGDTVLYDIDYSIDMPSAFLHLFVKWEYDNRALLAKKPEITKAADEIRKNAPKWEQTAVAMRDAYKRNPTDDNKSALEASLAVLRQATLEAAKYINDNSQ